MRRRSFLRTVGVASITWPFVLRAQAAGKIPIVGVLAWGASGRDEVIE
jgi:hypothetical protein